MADISQIKLPSGDTFDIIDEKSGYIKTSIYHGTSASEAADTTKVVTCENFTSSDLKAGAAILVTFSTTNSAAVASLALNVNGTGVKNVKYINNGTLGNLSSAGYLKANTTYLFIYDGTYWVAYFNYNTTYSSMSEAEARAGTATTARTVSAVRLKDTIDYTLENKTDYSIPVSRVGEIVVGETAIGTDSTNFPTSKAVVDYVDERVVQEIEAISVPTKTSDLTNDSGYLKSTDIDLDNYVPIEKTIGDTTYTYEIKYDEFSTFRQVRIEVSKGSDNFAAITLSGDGAAVLAGSEATEIYNVVTPTSNDMAANKKYVDDSIPKVYSSTNTGGYLTMATLPIYDGTVV